MNTTQRNDFQALENDTEATFTLRTEENTFTGLDRRTAESLAQTARQAGANFLLAREN